MSVPAGTTVPGTAGPLSARRVRGLRRVSFAAFVMLAAQFAAGIYVNLYVSAPKADNGHGAGRRSPTARPGLPCTSCSGCCSWPRSDSWVQAILARQPALITASALGLLAMIGAAASGSAFTGSGRNSASMAMASLAAAGLLCCGTSLFPLPRPAASGHDN